MFPWSLDLGAWDFLGIWILRFGVFHPHPSAFIRGLIFAPIFLPARNCRCIFGAIIIR
jgi:hypothetical protein